MFRLLLLALLFPLLAIACGGGNDDANSAPPDGVAVSVRSIKEADTVADLPPLKSDHRFVVIEVELKNGKSNDPISTAPVLFYLESDAGLQYLASVQAALLQGSCAGDALLSAGHSHACLLAFELPHGSLPARLHYRNEREDAASTPATIDHPCTPCGERCVDLRSDRNHCGACFTRTPRGGSCEVGVPTCPEALVHCADSCVDLATNLYHCGACNTPVPAGGSCEGTPHCPGGLASCGGACVNLNADDQNCGRCGNRCGDICLMGSCVQWETAEERQTCNVVCSGEGSSCAGDYGWMEYYDPQDDSQYVKYQQVPCNAMPPPSMEFQGSTFVFYQVGCPCAE